MSDAAIDPEGMRPASLETVRRQRAFGEAMRPIVIGVYPDVGAVVEDGRHRIAVARERGDRDIEAIIRHYAADGSVRRMVVERIAVD